MSSFQIAKLSKQTIIYGVGGFLTRIITFLLLPVFTAYLTPADYGISAILALITFIATPLVSLGIGVSMAPCYYDSTDFTQKHATVWTAFLTLTLSCIGFSFIGVGFQKQLSLIAFHTFDHADLIVLTVFSTVFSILSMPFMLYLQFEERAKQFVTLSLISTTISIGISFLLVVIFRQGVKGLVTAGLIGQALNFLLFLLPVLTKTSFRLEVSVAKKLLRLGLPLVPSFAMLFVLQDGNKYLLKWFSDVETVGVYAIGFNFGMVMSLLVSAFQRAWLPFFMSFKNNQKEGAAVFSSAMTYYVFVFGSISVLFFIAAKPIVYIMTQQPFHQAYQVVGLSAAAQFFIGIFYILLPGMYFTEEVKYVSLIQGFSAVVTTGLNILLIQLFGMLGAGIGLLSGFFIMTIFTLIWNYIRRNSYIIVHYNWKRLSIFLIIFIIFSTLMLVDRNFSLIQEIIYSAASCILFLLILYLILSTDEQKWLKGKLRNLFIRHEIKQQTIL
jgi:O-antigen/teichoic acid export membrane protein